MHKSIQYNCYCIVFYCLSIHYSLWATGALRSLGLPIFDGFNALRGVALVVWHHVLVHRWIVVSKGRVRAAIRHRGVLEGRFVRIWIHQLNKQDIRQTGSRPNEEPRLSILS